MTDRRPISICDEDVLTSPVKVNHVIGYFTPNATASSHTINNIRHFFTSRSLPYEVQTVRWQELETVTMNLDALVIEAHTQEILDKFVRLTRTYPYRFNVGGFHYDNKIFAVSDLNIRKEGVITAKRNNIANEIFTRLQYVAPMFTTEDYNERDTRMPALFEAEPWLFPMVPLVECGTFKGYHEPPSTDLFLLDAVEGSIFTPDVNTTIELDSQHFNPLPPEVGKTTGKPPSSPIDYEQKVPRSPIQPTNTKNVPELAKFADLRISKPSDQPSKPTSVQTSEQPSENKHKRKNTSPSRQPKTKRPRKIKTIKKTSKTPPLTFLVNTSSALVVTTPDGATITAFAGHEKYISQNKHKETIDAEKLLKSMFPPKKGKDNPIVDKVLHPTDYLSTAYQELIEEPTVPFPCWVYFPGLNGGLLKTHTHKESRPKPLLYYNLSKVQYLRVPALYYTKDTETIEIVDPWRVCIHVSIGNIGAWVLAAKKLTELRKMTAMKNGAFAVIVNQNFIATVENQKSYKFCNWPMQITCRNDGEYIEQAKKQRIDANRCDCTFGKRERGSK